MIWIFYSGFWIYYISWVGTPRGWYSHYTNTIFGGGITKHSKQPFDEIGLDRRSWETHLAGSSQRESRRSLVSRSQLSLTLPSTLPPPPPLPSAPMAAISLWSEILLQATFGGNHIMILKKLVLLKNGHKKNDYNAASIRKFDRSSLSLETLGEIKLWNRN